MEKEAKVNAKLKNFLQKRSELNDLRKQRNYERVSSRPAASYFHNSQLGRSQPTFQQARPVHPRLERSKSRQSVSTSRSERVNSLQKQQEQRHLQSFMSKLRRAE